MALWGILWLGIFLGLEMCFPCSLVIMVDSITQRKKYKLKEPLCCMITPTDYFIININNFNSWSNVLQRNTCSRVPPV